MATVTDMTAGRPLTRIFRFALPLILTNLGQQFYMIADAAIVGRGVGVDALAAVGATDWIWWLILWAVMGMTQGFSTYVSRYFGEGNRERMSRTVAASVTLTAALGIALTVAGILLARPLLILLNTPENIFAGAHTYLVTMSAGTLVVAAYNMAGSILRALGDGRTPFLAMVVAAVLNIGLDLLFVLGFGWGIFGAALASVLAQLVAFFLCFFAILRLGCIRITRDMWRPDRRLALPMLALGLPLAMQSVVISLGGIILQSSVNLEGSAFIAGYTATNKVYGLLECSAISLGLAASTFLSQNFGARRFIRFRQGMRAAVILSVLASLVVAVVAFLLRRPLIGLFLDTGVSEGAEALAVGVRYLTVLTLLLFILYLLHIFRNALLSLGNSFYSMISGIAELAARALMAKAAVRVLGQDALFLAEPIAWAVALAVVMIPYFVYRRTRLREE